MTGRALVTGGAGFIGSHAVDRRGFAELESGGLAADMSSVSLIEMGPVYMSEGRLLEDLSAVAALPNVKYAALAPDVAVASVYPRDSLGLSLFDSHHAAAALRLDGRMISFDGAYDGVPGLTRTDPAAI